MKESELPTAFTDLVVSGYYQEDYEKQVEY